MLIKHVVVGVIISNTHENVLESSRLAQAPWDVGFGPDESFSRSMDARMHSEIERVEEMTLKFRNSG